MTQAAEVIRRDPSLAPKFRLSSLVDDAEIQPNAYTYMLGIAVMALLVCVHKLGRLLNRADF